MSLNLSQVQQHLLAFDFAALFNELGWENPSDRAARTFTVGGADFERRMLAQLSEGVPALEITSANGEIPDATTRRAVHTAIAKLFHENLLIFVDRERTQSLWFWAKREDKKTYPREHTYLRGQAPDLMLSKLAGMGVDLSELDESGNLGVVGAAGKLKAALDVERVTKKFYGEFQKQHEEFIGYIRGIADERQRRWYASVLLNRLMFIYFLQRKGFLYVGTRPDYAADTEYLQRKLEDSQRRGVDLYYREFLQVLFFVGFAKPEDDRAAEEKQILGDVPYLNGGLFLPHQIENDNPDISISDEAFTKFFALLKGYSWNLDDTPTGNPDEINPDVLGYIFEKYINQKAFGAYYTRPEITGYLCEQTIHQLILEKANAQLRVPPLGGISRPAQIPPKGGTLNKYDSLADLMMNLDAHLCGRLFYEWLPELKLLDPACGSGAFLVAALKTLINIYSAVVGRSEFIGGVELRRELADLRQEHHGSLNYFIKKRIITDNLFGVDLMEEATEIAKLRLFLALVASIKERNQLEPLPNIDFNIMAGNSLIGLLRVEDNDFIETQPNLFRQSFREIVEIRERNIENYRKATSTEKDLTLFRDEIRKGDEGINEILDEILLKQFSQLNIKFEEATWDKEKQKEGKPKKRSVTLKHLQDLKPFHWGYNFSTVLNHTGGFDAIITNPPWEIFKPQAKEFFAEHSELVTKNKMTIKEFEKKQDELLQDAEIRAAWLAYQSRYPHVSLYFRNAPQYRNQIAVVNGKKAGTDINLYKLFLEQCFNLLRQGGQCGIVIPSGIYTDLGAKQLREMLFNETEITSLFGFENRKLIFEGVDSRFKFVVLTFSKSGQTQSFPTAFMRHHVAELERFPQHGALPISVGLIRRLSPDSLSMMEFKNNTDIGIAEKMLRFPLLGREVDGAWRVEFCNEFHMTGDSGLFRTAWQKGRLPLYEGKMIHQFTHNWGEPRYWLDETEAAQNLLATRRRAAKQAAKREEIEWDEDEPLSLDYQSYRLAFRDVAASTNERTMIATVLPPHRFCPHTMSLEAVYLIRAEDGELNPNYQPMNHAARLFLCAVMNSFIVDAWLRRSVTNHLSFFFVYGVPVPRLTARDGAFAPIVARAARLICTAPEFDELAREVGLGDHTAGVTDAPGRARLRAELDGLIAHLYGLTEDEFTYILTTFPLVSETVKVAAHNAYRDVERGLIQ